MNLRFLLVGLAAVLVSACGSDEHDDDTDSHPSSAGSGGTSSDDKEGLRMCCEIGAICHQVSSQSDALHDCHDLGHVSDPAECRKQYDSCLAACKAAGAGGGDPHACVE